MVRAKKHLGQHFLKDQDIARKITGALKGSGGYSQVLEIGSGTGVLSQYLLSNKSFQTWMIDIDRESIGYLKKRFPLAADRIIEGDFLSWSPGEVFKDKFAVIGNFPYHISSQIFFRILDMPQKVPEVVCMLQKEVAQRLAAPPGNKTYGILSVLLQAYYQIEYLFDVPPHLFHPPPKVYSGVIRLQSLEKEHLGCDETIFRKLVKQGFQNRRKTLRNALKAFNLPPEINKLEILNQRAEQLSVEQYVSLTKIITPLWRP